MKDFVGKELKVGDEVIYLSHNRTSSELHRGKVIDFTLKKVRLDTYFGRRLPSLARVKVSSPFGEDVLVGGS